MPAAVENCRRLAANYPNGALTIVDENFYEVAFDTQFDVVYYWEGRFRDWDR